MTTVERRRGFPTSHELLSTRVIQSKQPNHDRLFVPEDVEGTEVPQGRLRKSRSHSLSSSLRRLFKKKDKNKGDVSRESSISRASGRDVSREGSVSHSSPQTGVHECYTTGSHQMAPDFSPEGYAYSSSVPPTTSPLTQH